MRCRVFQKYLAHGLVTTLSTHRHAAFWNTRHAVVFPMFQKWSFGASSRDSGRYVDAYLKQTAIPQINQMAISFKTFKMPSLREMWVTSSTKRQELRHEDFWNTWHTAPRRPFQNVHVERCVTSIHPYNPFLHEAPRASSQRLLKQTARCAAPPVSKCQSWALRRQYISIQPISPRSDGSFVTKTFETDGTQRHAVCFIPYPHEATGASSRRLLKHMAHSATPSVSKCACWAAPSVSKCESWVLRRQYISIQPISPRSDGSFVTKTFETHGTQRHAVCFKMCMLSAASPVYIHTRLDSHWLWQWLVSDKEPSHNLDQGWPFSGVSIESITRWIYSGPTINRQ